MITNFFKKGSQIGLTVKSVIKVIDNDNTKEVEFYRLGDVLLRTENRCLIIVTNREEEMAILRAIHEKVKHEMYQFYNTNEKLIILEVKENGKEN